MGVMASRITSVSIVYSIVCSGVDQRKHQSSASLAFVRGIHRWPVNSPHKGPVTRKMCPFDDVIMEWHFIWGTLHIITFQYGAMWFSLSFFILIPHDIWEIALRKWQPILPFQSMSVGVIRLWLKRLIQYRFQMKAALPVFKTLIWVFSQDVFFLSGLSGSLLLAWFIYMDE